MVDSESTEAKMPTREGKAQEREMDKINRTIDLQTGTYHREKYGIARFTLTCHRDGSVTVRYPYIRWVGNSGSLDFTKTKIKAGKRAKMVKHFFEIGELVDENQYVLENILKGY